MYIKMPLQQNNNEGKVIHGLKMNISLVLNWKNGPFKFLILEISMQHIKGNERMYVIIESNPCSI